MTDPDLAIIPCPQCGVKNRIRYYSADKIPVCARCQTKLIDEKENAAFQKFQDGLKKFKDFPDVGVRSKPPE